MADHSYQKSRESWPLSDDACNWIAEASHELRLPIANLRLLMETLLNGAAEEPQVRQRMLSRAKEEVERLQQLVVNLLSAEQITSGDELQRTWHLLKHKVDYALESLSQAVSEKALRIEVEIEPDWHIYANSQQLDQVLLNLLENAVKFTPAGGRVLIKSGPNAGAFSIQDSGIGMAAEEIPKIFNRFYRIDRSQFRGSTGLGLSIVKHIADLHGAKIDVSSQPGVGSEFLLEFPGPA